MCEVCTDYRIAALDFLLCEDCLPARYAPLVGYKPLLLFELPRLSCERKSDAEKLSDEALWKIGLPADIVPLFRLFLTLYDPRPQKTKELERLSLSQEERDAYRELYCLPGVKQVRAALYFDSGFASLRAFAEADAEELIRRCQETIQRRGLSCVAPLPKEARTQIAVAKAFTESR